MDYMLEYEQEKAENIRRMTEDPATADVVKAFFEQVNPYQYGYYNTWMGRPIIQLAQDMVALQEIVMRVKPDLIIETGIAHGGSILYSASLLELLSVGEPGRRREVVAIDIDLREHNRRAIAEHPMFRRVTILIGSSIDAGIVGKVREIARRHQTVMLLLDSCHTHAHVLAELNAYGGLVTPGSYAVVSDTAIEFSSGSRADRPWGKGNNPYTAVQEYLKDHPEFVYDASIAQRILLTACPGGWLQKVRPAKEGDAR